MKQFKKVLAFVLALAMVVTAVPTADAKAAAKAPKLNNYKKILYVGQSYTLKVNNLPANWKKCTYAWSASNKNVTVKKGKYGQAANVKAVKAGTATVTVKMTYPQTAAQKKAKKKTVKTFKCVVTVKNPSVKFTTTADRIEVGETAQFTAKATPSTAKVTYSSSDAAVATVDATGLVTAVANGTATIKATAKVGTKTVSASKTVEVYTAPTEAKQTKVKEITITSGKVVTKESKIAVKKGSVEVALAEKDGIAIDATGKTVVLTTAAKLAKGEYTVTIDGVTANFTAEDEKVSKIEFLGDKAVLNAKTCNDAEDKPEGECTDAASHKYIYKTATVAYKVYNQFGEDITDTTSVKASGSDVASETPDPKGIVTFKSRSTDGYRLNDIVAAVVIYNQNGVAVTQSGTFTISNESAVSEIEIKDGVYNKKGEAVTLTEDTDLAKDKLYVLVAAKDQYGRAVTSLTDEVNVLVQIAGGLTNLTLNGANPASEEITVDGVKYAGFRLRNSDKIGAGTATLIIISKGTGKTAQGTVTVANGAKVDTIEIQVPDLIVAGEDNKLGYTALDSYGKEVTKLSSLLDVTNIETEANVGTDGIYAKENPATGKAELYYRAKSNPAKNGWDPTAVIDYDTVSLITKTYKSKAVNFSIKPNKQATAIVGTDNLTTGCLTDKQFAIVKQNIKVADQYGRTDKLNIDTDYKIFAYFPDKKAGNNAFDLTDSTTYKLFNNLNGKDKDGAITDAVEITKKTGDNPTNAQQVTAKIVDPDKDPVTKVRFVLAPFAVADARALASDVDEGKNVLSTYDVTFTASQKTNVVSYEVADIGTIYCGKEIASGGSVNALASKYNKKFDVKGVTADGTKVNVTDYTVTATGLPKEQLSKLITASNVKLIKADDLESQVVAGVDQALTKNDTAEITLTFTFEDGKQIEKKVTLTKAKPQVKEVKIKDKKEALEVLVNGAADTAYKQAVAVKAELVKVQTAIHGLASNADNATIKAEVKKVVDLITDTAVKGAVNTKLTDLNQETNKADAVSEIDSVVGTATGEVTAAVNAIADIYAAIKGKIEAKDQYGVDIASVLDPTTAKNVTVTVSNAKDYAGNDVTITNVTNNGANAAFTTFNVGSKADVKLVFDGGFVFSAKVVGVKSIIKQSTVAPFAAATLSGDTTGTTLYTALAAKITDASDLAELVKITVNGTTIDKNSTDPHGLTISAGATVVYTFSTGETISVELQ